MNRIIVIAILLWSSANVFAQNPLFNQTFCTDTALTITPAVQVLPDGYLLFGQYNDVSNNERIYMRKLDLNGYPQWLRVIDDEWDNNQNIDAELNIIERGTQVLATTDNHIVLSYSKDTIALTGTSDNVYLTKLDLNGNKIWQHNYGIYNRDEICRHVIETADGGFMLVGTRGEENNEPGASFYVIKTDAAGILEWDTTYVANWGQAFSVQQTPWDGGYIIGGAGRTDTTLYDMWVIKITATGQLEWEQNFDGYEWSDCAAHVSILTTLSEYQNNQPIRYLILGCHNMELATAMDHAYINVLDENGNIVWERSDYDTSIPDFDVFGVKPLVMPDKSFVAIVSTLSPRPSNVLVHFAPNGDVLSTQLITIDSEPTQAPDYDLYLKDIQATPDGGYVLAGYQFSPNPQKSWIVKTDSMGLTVPVEDCESVNTAIETAPQFMGQGASVFSLSPNPATTQATLYIAQPAAHRQLRIYNMSGQQVKNLSLPDYIAQYHFSVADLPAGVYVCKVGDALGQKLVVGK
jgi:hypothetical protein